MQTHAEFWSSTEYATFQKALVRELQECGLAASDRFSVSITSYWNARRMAERLWLRVLCYLYYPIRVWLRFLRADCSTVGVVCTNTFFAPWVAMMASGRRGIPVVNWVFDLFPDVLTVAGKLRAGSVAERFLRRWVRSSFDRAAANVFLGEHLLAYAVERFGPIARSRVIPVGADGAPFRDHLPAAREGNGPVTVLYCGNLGRMHDVDTVAGAIRQGLPDGVRLDFRGNGAGFRVLRTAVSDLNAAVSFGENIEGLDWIDAMTAADVALVTLRHGAEGLVMPSKTYSAMVAGQAILAVCPRNSDLAETVLRHEAGWVVEPGNVEGLSRMLQHIVSNPDEVFRRRMKSFEAGHETYDQSVLADSWVQLLRPLAQSSVNAG